MTDLTDRLAALGVTLPEVEALADPRTARDIERLRANYNGVEQLQAALAAVVGLLEDARHHNWVESQAARKATKRAEKAEDQRMQLKADIDTLRGLLDRAEAENARLLRLLDKPFLEKLAELEAENARLREAWRNDHNALTDRGSELLAENKLLVDHAAEHERLQKQAEAALVMRAIAKQEADHD